MPFSPASASNSQHIPSTNNLTPESGEPLIQISRVRNTDIPSDNEGWSTGTKVALGVTGAVIATGTLITAVGQGSPVAGLAVIGGALGLSGMQSSSAVAASPEPLPVAVRLAGEQATATSSIDTCNRLITSMSAMNGQRIDEISLTELQSVKDAIEGVSTLDLNTLSSQQCNELGTCFGVSLMAGKISPLKIRLENAQTNIMNGNTQTLAGELSARLFHPIEVLRKNLLLAEVEPRLEVIKEIHAKNYAFVEQINNRILSDLS